MIGSRRNKVDRIHASAVQDAQTSPGWSNVVVVYAGTSWDGPPASEKQLTIALSRHVPVLYVDPGVSFVRNAGGARRLRPSAAEITIVQPNVARLITLVPPG